MVLLTHVQTCDGFPKDGLLHSIAVKSFEGVSLFFVLSGFLVTWLLLKEEERNGSFSLKSFYFRRAVRILPAASFFLISMVVVGKVIGVTLVSFDGFMSSLFFFRNYYLGEGVDGHFWTLSIEEQFYILWPFFLWLMPARFRIKICLALLVFAPVWRQINIWSFGAANVNWRRLDLRYDHLLIGCALALAQFDPSARRFFDLMRRYANWVFLSGFSIFTLMTLGLLSMPLLSLNISVKLVGIAMIVFGAISMRGGIFFYSLNAPPVVWLGRLSYSLYLWQQLFCVKSLDFQFQVFPLNLVWTLITGLVSFYLVEQPALARRDGWVKRLKLG